MSKEVLIVGGGVVGLSIAYYLASTNHSVRIIERDDSLKKAVPKETPVWWSLLTSFHLLLLVSSLRD